MNLLYSDVMQSQSSTYNQATQIHSGYISRRDDGDDESASSLSCSSQFSLL